MGRVPTIFPSNSSAVADNDCGAFLANPAADMKARDRGEPAADLLSGAGQALRLGDRHVLRPSRRADPCRNGVFQRTTCRAILSGCQDHRDLRGDKRDPTSGNLGVRAQFGLVAGLCRSSRLLTCNSRLRMGLFARRAPVRSTRDKERAIPHPCAQQESKS